MSKETIVASIAARSGLSSREVIDAVRDFTESGSVPEGVNISPAQLSMVASLGGLELLDDNSSLPEEVAEVEEFIDEPTGPPTTSIPILNRDIRKPLSSNKKVSPYREGRKAQTSTPTFEDMAKERNVVLSPAPLKKPLGIPSSYAGEVLNEGAKGRVSPLVNEYRKNHSEEKKATGQSVQVEEPVVPPQKSYIRKEVVRPTPTGPITVRPKVSTVVEDIPEPEVIIPRVSTPVENTPKPISFKRPSITPELVIADPVEEVYDEYEEPAPSLPVIRHEETVLDVDDFDLDDSDANFLDSLGGISIPEAEPTLELVDSYPVPTFSSFVIEEEVPVEEAINLPLGEVYDEHEELPPSTSAVRGEEPVQSISNFDDIISPHGGNEVLSKSTGKASFIPLGDPLEVSDEYPLDDFDTLAPMAVEEEEVSVSSTGIDFDELISGETVTKPKEENKSRRSKRKEKKAEKTALVSEVESEILEDQGKVKTLDSGALDYYGEKVTRKPHPVTVIFIILLVLLLIATIGALYFGYNLYDLFEIGYPISYSPLNILRNWGLFT